MRLRDLTLGYALAELGDGVRETRENWGPEVKQYLRETDINVPAPWCAAFVNWCAAQAADELGTESPLEYVPREALVLDYATTGEDRGWVVLPEEARPGDLVCFRFGDGQWNHMGLLMSKIHLDGMGFMAVEGNTNDDGAREGYEVAKRDRHHRPGRTLFLRWDEEIRGDAQPVGRAA